MTGRIHFFHETIKLYQFSASHKLKFGVPRLMLPTKPLKALSGKKELVGGIMHEIRLNRGDSEFGLREVLGLGPLSKMILE